MLVNVAPFKLIKGELSVIAPEAVVRLKLGLLILEDAFNVIYPVPKAAIELVVSTEIMGAVNTKFTSFCNAT